MKIRLLMLMIFLSTICCAQNKTGKLYNLDFEELNETSFPTGWGLGNILNDNLPKDSSINAFRIDSSKKQHGKYSLLIDWNKKYKEWTAVNYVINQTFYGSQITLKGYIKTENVNGIGAGLWMRIDGKNKVLAFDNMMTRPILGTTDWTEYAITLPYNQEEVKDITIGILIDGEGKVWIDNLSLAINDTDISQSRIYTPKIYKAALDSSYNHASGVISIALSQEKIKELTNLGMLWGFIKYYHAEVNKGNYNMDAELFRVLPKIIASKSMTEANKILESWVDGFGIPPLCSDCGKIVKSPNTILLPDYGYLFLNNNLPKSLTDKLEYIKTNRYNNEQHYYAKSDQGIGISFSHEIPYNDQSFPDAGLRLLSLYRYWNMVQYFSPNRQLIGEDWNKTLSLFIPEFIDAKNALQYQQVCLKLISRIHDTHANIWSGGTEIEKSKGNWIMPFRARFIENKLVVTDFYNDTFSIRDKIKPGDIIEKIDGTAVTELVKKYLPFTSASNYETQLRNMSGAMGHLLRSNKQNVQIAVSRNRKSININVPCINFEDYMPRLDYYGSKINNGYKLIEKNVGYIYPCMLREKDIDSIKILFKNTTGIIIDMRCYPSVFMPYTYGEWLKPDSSLFVKFSGGSVNVPGSFEMVDSEKNGNGKGNSYKGRLVIIVNEITQSHAEFTAIALSTVPGSIVLGSRTSGADGGIFQIALPGGINTAFSGVGVYYIDGTVTQRKGVKIDRVVKPTIKGIREGRDELMGEAIKIIKG